MLNRDEASQDQNPEENINLDETPDRKRKEGLSPIPAVDTTLSKKKKPVEASASDINELDIPFDASCVEPELALGGTASQSSLPKRLADMNKPLGHIFPYQVGSADSSLNTYKTDPSFSPEADADIIPTSQIDDADKKQKVSYPTLGPTLAEVHGNLSEKREITDDRALRPIQSDACISLSSSFNTPVIHRGQSESNLSLAAPIAADTSTFAYDVIYQYEKVLVEEMNYSQLIHINVPEDHSFMRHPGMKPINDKGAEVNGVATFSNALGSIGGRMSARLFSKDNSIYLLLLRNLFNTPEKDLMVEKIRQNLKDDKVFKEFRDGVLIAVIALVRNQHGHIELQLRVIPNAEGFGHPGLVFKNEGNDPLCIVVAGEIYILNGEIILVNDKSGNFADKLKIRLIPQKDILDFLLKPYYSEKYKDSCFWPATEDDTVTVHEVLSRGFPHSLLRPQKLKGEFPIEKLPSDIQDIAITAEKDYQLRKQRKAKPALPVNLSVAEPAKFPPAPVISDAPSAPVAASDDKVQNTATVVTQTQTSSNLFKKEPEQTVSSATASTPTNQSSFQSN